MGLIDATAFTKHRLTGPGATAFLDWFTCNKLPKVGRINLTYALTAQLGPRGPNTPSCARGRTTTTSSRPGRGQAYDQDYLYKAIADKEAEFGRVNAQDVTTQWGVFAIAGPKSREVLGALIRDADPETALSNKRFPWLSACATSSWACAR